MTVVDFTQEDVTKSLMAVVAWAGSYPAARRYLAENGIQISMDRLRRWCTDTHRTEFEELRDRHASEIEKQMAHEFRDIAAQAVRVQRIALEKAEARLVAREDKEPAKTAMQASRVSQTAVDKLLQLTSRPTKITENRSVDELIRSLAGSGVLVPLPAGSRVVVDVEAEDGEADDADE